MHGRTVGTIYRELKQFQTSFQGAFSLAASSRGTRRLQEIFRSA